MVGAGRSETSWERLPRAGSAAAYAEHKHAGQLRSDGTPFVTHPREVATLLYDAGAPEDVIAAGLLHDVVEKAGVSASELRGQFGPDVTRVVLAVTDDAGIKGYAARKAALRHQVAGAGTEALTVFAADKLSKLRELQRTTAGDPGGRIGGSRARRLRHYQRSLALLQERLPESPLVRALRDELESALQERTPSPVPERLRTADA